MAARTSLRRTLIGVGTVLAVLCLLPLGWIQWMRAQGERQYQEQLALARKDGIPTTPEEFDALIPRAEPHENAALHYRKLDGANFELSICESLQFKLIREPTNEVRQQAEKYLETHGQTLAHLDAATDLPKCWFERDPRKAGLSRTGSPSHAYSAAPILALRGTLKMLDGDPEAAIADADRIAKMGLHFGQEPTPAAESIRSNMESKTLRAIADWCFARRGDATYLRALNERIGRFQKSMDERPIPAVWVVNGAYALERVWTSAGRKELGLKDTTLSQNIRLALAPSATKANIMAGLREVTRVSALRQEDRTAAMSSARLNLSLAAIPLAGIVDFLAPELGDSRELFREIWVFYRALGRAFAQTEIPKQLDTSDLISPATGKPVDYSFDGYRIKIGMRDFVVKYEIPP